MLLFFCIFATAKVLQFFHIAKEIYKKVVVFFKFRFNVNVL